MNRRSGFTIIELMMALSLFAVIASIASGVFIRSLRTQRSAVALIAATSNAGLALEQMAREMRTGRTFSGGGKTLTFINAKSENITYRFNDTAGTLERSTDGTTFHSLTGTDVRVVNTQFTLFTGSPGDRYPTRITIGLRVGVVNSTLAGTTVDLQTSVSSRVLE